MLSDDARREPIEEAPIWEDSFDHVILACHGSQILPILSGQLDSRRDSKIPSSYGLGMSPGRRVAADMGASIDEYKIFSCFKTTENICYLHSDLSLMPQRRNTWSSWNYLISSSPSRRSHPAGVSLTYNMNILQHIPTQIYGDVLVTMNPGHAPPQEKLQGEFTYQHPLYTVEAVRAQEKLESLQNKGGVSYCGAWTKYGFHEDGFSSGLKVAKEHLGGQIPFNFRDSTYSRGLNPEPLLLDYVVRIMISIVMAMVRFGERLLDVPGVAIVVAMMLFIPRIMLDLLETTGLFA